MKPVIDREPHVRLRGSDSRNFGRLLQQGSEMIRIEILRRAPGETKSRLEAFGYDPEGPSETVATALTRLNERAPLVDEEGRERTPIRWECSCLQKKCGACAMVINGTPALACNAPLRAYKRSIRLEPLRKFPVIADLVVDRSVMQENLRQMRIWLEEDARLNEKVTDVGYEGSRCLQCGLCLEVCPNFDPEGRFAGMAAAVPMTRLLAEMAPTQRKEAAATYRNRVFEGCGKSLACRDVCPVGIELDELLSRSNAAALWNRWIRRN